MESVSVRPSLPVIPSVSAVALGTSSGSVIVASSTSHTRRRSSVRDRWAAASASVVFPMPPGPMSVTTGDRVIASAIRSSSLSRPKSWRGRRGRLPLTTREVRSGGWLPS